LAVEKFVTTITVHDKYRFRVTIPRRFLRGTVFEEPLDVEVEVEPTKIVIKPTGISLVENVLKVASEMSIEEIIELLGFPAGTGLDEVAFKLRISAEKFREIIDKLRSNDVSKLKPREITAIYKAAKTSANVRDAIAKAILMLSVPV